jgi:hypothetical protein
MRAQATRAYARASTSSERQAMDFPAARSTSHPLPADRGTMSLKGEQLAAPVPTNQAVEQVLLALADGSYVLSTPDGVVAECGVGVVALVGSSAEQLAGQPVVDVLASAADEAQRAAFERLLRGERDGAEHAFPTATAGASARALQLVVVSVPLALGWEFTSLLGELGARDADSWDPGPCASATSARSKPSRASSSPARSRRSPEPGWRAS